MTDAALPPLRVPHATYQMNWPAALKALRKLLNDKNDTVQVFEIMRALNGAETVKSYHKLLDTVQGGRLAYERVELAERLTDRAFIQRFAPGTLGAAYRDFLDRTGYSADGLAEISKVGAKPIAAAHPYAWFGRRVRDQHDLWHVLTGYKADEGLGEACLVAFSYAQTKGLGWALIGVGAALRGGLFTPHARAIWEGYRHGRHAAWLMGEDWEANMAEPLEALRKRLRILPATRYEAIPPDQRDAVLKL